DKILSSNSTVKFLGITTDQQLYKPKKDARILVSAISYPSKKVKLTFRRNGAIWFDETVELSTAGLYLHTLTDLEIGKYDASGEVLLDDAPVSIGTVSFDVAAFELDPFQVIIESQSMSKSQQLTANCDVSILHAPYSGPLKVGLFCSFCQSVVLRDEVNCKNGKATVSFNVGGHTAPFSLEFIVPERGYTAMIQLEGTMPHQRLPTPITANLKQNYQMSLFPETGSIAVQGVNITQAEINKDSFYEVESLLGDEISLKITADTELLGITTFNPVTQELNHESLSDVKKGTTKTFSTCESHVIVFFAGIDKKDMLYEGFCIGFRSPDSLLEMDVPESLEAGEMLSITINNPSNVEQEETEAFLLVFDKRKTHGSLYKAIGEKVHSHLKHGFEILPNQVLNNYSERKDWIFGREKDVEKEEMLMEMLDAAPVTSAPKMSARGFGGAKMKKGRMAPPRMAPIAPPAASPAPPPPSGGMALSQATSGSTDVEHKSSAEVPTEMFEDFEEVLYVDTFSMASKETKIVDVPLADQITTWEVRLYSFQGLRFNEVVKNVSAEKTRFVDIRAPAIIDAENGDTAEIEIHYLTEVKGTIEVFLGDSIVVPSKEIKAGAGLLRETIKQKGKIRVFLKTEKYNIEAVKDVKLPFEQELVYTHMTHLYPGESFTPPQEVLILPNPLPLIRESVHALQGYPFGCAEQASAKLGALALAYKYHQIANTGEELPLFGMIKQGIGRVFSLYFNKSNGMFGLWSAETANEKVTVQVLRNLSPLYPLLGEFNLTDYKKSIDSSINALIKKKVKSFNLTIYSPEFIPDRKVKDPLEAAWALISTGDSPDVEKWLEVIESEAISTEEACKWESPLAWAGSLQATAAILRALNKRESMLSDEMKKLFNKAFHYVMSNMINGRLFSTTDTLALIGLFTDIPVVETKVEIDGEIKTITESFRIDQEFVAKTIIYAHWVEEILANPFADLPAESTKLKVKLAKDEFKIGEEFDLVIAGPGDMFCPVAAICLPPHIAMMKGGGNIQQHYLPFRDEKHILLELVCIRKGTGHIRVIVHDMYKKEQIIKPEPIAIKVK
ncbi:MAG: hypothetical protein ACFFCS_23215, partial [Candidatus Hodarchaeota archaeon]